MPKSHLVSKNKPLYSFRAGGLMVALNFKIVVIFFVLPFLTIGLGSGRWFYAFVIGLIFAFGLGFLFFKEAMDLLFTSCNLYKTHMEVLTGWLHIHRRVASYDQIVDIAYDQKVLERLFNLGSIIITTTSIHHERMEIKYIKEPYEKYKKITEIVGKHIKKRFRYGKSRLVADED